MTAADYSIIEGAYLSGFEPSDEALTGEAVLREAEDFLFNLQFS